MPEFLVEVYSSRFADRAPGSEQVARAADQLTREGSLVRLMQSVFVPGDETCFYLFQARSSGAVVAAMDLCGLRFERITEAVSEIRAVSNTKGER